MLAADGATQSLTIPTGTGARVRVGTDSTAHQTSISFLRKADITVAIPTLVASITDVGSGVDGHHRGAPMTVPS